MSVLLFALQMALGIIVPWWIVKRDLSRLDPQRLARAWRPVSFWMAIVVFGPLALPFHFTKTRRSLTGLGLGVLWTLAALVVLSVVASALSALFGVE